MRLGRVDELGRELCSKDEEAGDGPLVLLRLRLQSCELLPSETAVGCHGSLKEPGPQ